MTDYKNDTLISVIVKLNEVMSDYSSNTIFPGQGTDIGQPETGLIPDITTITVGKDFIGCLSELKIGTLDFLPAKCGYPRDFMQNSVLYVEGTCAGDNTESVVCPDTEPPKPAPKPETQLPKPGWIYKTTNSSLISLQQSNKF